MKYRGLYIGITLIAGIIAFYVPVDLIGFRLDLAILTWLFVTALVSAGYAGIYFLYRYINNRKPKEKEATTIE